MDEIKQNFHSSIDDDLCIRGAESAEMLELLNDGQSQIFKEISIEENQSTMRVHETNTEQATTSTIQRPQSEEENINFHKLELTNDLKCSAAVRTSIEHTYI